MAGYRRFARGKLDAAGELKAWSKTFATGYDYLNALAIAGISINKHHQPPLSLARDAWARLGEEFLAANKPAPVEPGAQLDEESLDANRRPPVEPWALLTFGSPEEARAVAIKRTPRTKAKSKGKASD